jgi:hypothetical protein
MIRLFLSLSILKGSYSQLSKGEILPWMLLSYGLLIFPQGGWAQPTALGFSILMGGLMLSSLNTSIKGRRVIRRNVLPAVDKESETNRPVS